ncbi:D-alanyl-D-alanine carboxypeptidase [Streptomyces chumphonensis]|uniref:D-alanyl-D-alanine carboxypeptidase family protein n=1 Tax=Streptomyces chumphonensis TaxID=1214925 RepID=UPI003D75C1B2
MAGESPERSEQRMSSGETPEGGPVVPSGRRAGTAVDPRGAFGRSGTEPSAEDGTGADDGEPADDPAADAAPAAGGTAEAEPTGPQAEAPTEPTEPATAAEPTVATDGPEAAGPEPEAADGAEEATEADAPPPVDPPTAVIRTPAAPEDAADAADEVADARPDTARSEGGDAEDDASGPDAEPGAPAADPPTTAFRAVAPAPAADPEPAPEAKPKPKTQPDADPEPDAGPEPEPEPEPGAKPGAGGADGTASRYVPLRDDARDAATAEAPEPERTRQQPLPPVPGQRAVDLLAELTNRPAPPPTPLRTFVRRVKIWTPLVALLAIVLVTAQLLRPLPEPALELTATDAYTFEGERPEIAWPTEGQAALDVEGLGSFGTHGEQKPVPIASVAKTMTAYVLLTEHPMEAGEAGASIPVDATAEKEAGYSEQGESTVGVEAGETITQEEALNALMIASANNVARLVARWDAGSEKAFVEKMNAAAQDLGMKNTTYTDPSGLLKETVSTAEDQVKLGRAVMEMEVFRDVVAKPAYTDRNGKEHANWNRLVPLYGTVGIKTGTTTAAGGNLLFAAYADVGGTRQLIIGAVLGQHRPPIIDSVLAAGKDLILSAQKALTAETVVREGDVVGVVDDGLGGRTRLVATEDVEAVGWPGLTVRLELAEGADGVPGEADAGTEVGVLTVGDGPGQVKVPVALAEPLSEPGAGAKLTRVL